MDKWIHNVVTNNIKRGKIAESDEEIYEYGYTLMFEKIIIFVISVAIALIMDAIWEMLALCISFIPLRVYSGGYHAKSRWGCMIMSSLFLLLGIVGIGLLSQQINTVIYLFVNIICFSVTISIAPVDIKQKQLTASECNYYRERIIIVFCIEFLLGFICIKYDISIVVAGIILSNVCNMFSVLGQKIQEKFV